MHPPCRGSWVSLLSLYGGATPAATKYAVVDIDAFTVGILRTVIAGVAVTPALWLRSLPPPADGRGWRLLAVSALSGFVCFPVLFSLAIDLTSTAHAALILALAPVLTGSLGAVIEKRRPGRQWWIGVAVAMAGEAALIMLRDGDGRGATLSGDLLALASCAAVAGGYVAGSRLSPAIGTLSVTARGAVSGSVVLLPVLAARLALDGWPVGRVAAWTATVWLALLSSLLAYAAWYRALAQGGIARISALQFLQPVVTLVLGTLRFAEDLTPALLLSGAAVLIGVAIARRG